MDFELPSNMEKQSRTYVKEKKELEKQNQKNKDNTLDSLVSRTKKNAMKCDKVLGTIRSEQILFECMTVY